MKNRLLIHLLVFICLVLFCQNEFVQADEDGHSHFRFGHITWTKKSGSTNTAEFTFTAAFRRCGYPGSDTDGCPAVGDVIPEWIGGTNLCFGDGQCTSWLNFKVFGVNKQEDWLIGRALDPNDQSKEIITHVYNGPGPFTAFTYSCCRTFDSRHINNPSGYYRVEGIVNFTNNTDNPKSLLPPIVSCIQNSESGCRFKVATIDGDIGGDGRQLQFRLANSSEAGWGFRQPGPPFATNPASVGLNTGEYTWNTTGAQLNPNGETLYSTQVIIEEKDGNNTISKSALDFFIRLVPPEETISEEKIIKIPVRWCVAEGLFDTEKINEEIQKRLNCVNNNIFSPQANLQFVSPLGRTSFAHFPTIPSQDPVQVSDLGNLETLCRRIWERESKDINGIVAVLVNEFEGQALGYGGDRDYVLYPDNVSVANIFNKVWVSKDASECNLSLFTGDHNVGHTLGQELGHALSLAHGDGSNSDNDGLLDEDPSCTQDKAYADKDGDDRCDEDPIDGIDNDNDGKIDEDTCDEDGDGICDEDGPGTKDNPNLMGYGSGHSHIIPFISEELKSTEQDRKKHSIFLTKEQATHIRSQALLISDSKIESTPRGDFPNLPLASIRTDSLGDVPLGEESIDINIVSVTVDPKKGITTFSLSTPGVPEQNGTNLEYFFLVDLDNNLSTGGAPSSIGIASLSQGIDLIGQVHITNNNGDVLVVPTLWKFNSISGQFLEIKDPDIKAKLILLGGPASDQGPESETFSTLPMRLINVEAPNAVVGNINNTAFSIETTAENLNTGAADNMVAEMTFDVPDYPDCQVVPLDTVLGSTVTVGASDLPPNSSVEVFLGTELMATGSTDSIGSTNISLRILENTSTGTRPVTVIKTGTGITANCHVNLQGPPRFDVPPSPAVGNTFAAYTGSTLNFTIQASDPDENDTVALGAIGLPSGSSFPLPSAANIVNTSFSWTPSAGQEGDYVVVFTASDNRGLSAPPHSIIIRVIAKRLGDLDGDNDIDYADYKIFRTTLGKCTGQAGFIPDADYDGDGCVTYADYKIWYGYYKNQ